MPDRYSCTRLLVLLLIAGLMTPARSQDLCRAGWTSSGGVPGVYGGAEGGHILDAVRWDPDGAGPAMPVFVLSGSFTSCAGVAATDLASWNPATGVFTPFPGSAGVRLRTLIVTGDGGLLGAGTFPGSALPRVARWAGGGWQMLGTPFSGSIPESSTPYVHALVELDNGDILAGGAFTSAGGVPARCIARWNGQAWSAVGVGIGIWGGPVSTLAALPGGRFVAGGLFNYADYAFSQGIVRWNGSAYASMQGLAAEANVSALAIEADGDIILGGNFTIEGVGRTMVARWRGGTWERIGPVIPQWTTSAVQWLRVEPDGDILAAGTFGLLGSVNTGLIARWAGATWGGLGFGAGGTGVYAIADLPGGELLAAGAFTRAGGVHAVNIARSEDGQWRALAPGGFDAPVTALLATRAGTLVAGGRFTTTPGGTAWSVAQLGPGGWLPMGAGFDPGMYGGVYTLTDTPNGTVIAGGNFEWVFGTPDYFENLAAWDGAAWRGLNGFWGCSLVSAVLVQSDTAFTLGGNFDWGCTHMEPYQLARWNGSSREQAAPRIGEEWECEPILAMVAMPGQGIIAGGYLHEFEPTGTRYLARWDGEIWHPFGQPNLYVHALATLADGGLVAGGEFTSIGGVAANLVARWDGQEWSALGPGPGGTRWVNCLLEHPSGVLIAGGYLAAAQGAPHYGIARWDGQSWEPLGGGVNGTVDSMALLPNGDVAVGGYFTHAGGVHSPYLATYSFGVPCCDPDFTCDGNTDQDDVGCIINAVAGNPGCACQDPDFNRDGNVDQEDVAALIGVVAGGPCP